MRKLNEGIKSVRVVKRARERETVNALVKIINGWLPLTTNRMKRFPFIKIYKKKYAPQPQHIAHNRKTNENRFFIKLLI